MAGSFAGMTSRQIALSRRFRHGARSRVSGSLSRGPTTNRSPMAFFRRASPLASAWAGHDPGSTLAPSVGFGVPPKRTSLTRRIGDRSRTPYRRVRKFAKAGRLRQRSGRACYPDSRCGAAVASTRHACAPRIFAAVPSVVAPRSQAALGNADWAKFHFAWRRCLARPRTGLPIPLRLVGGWDRAGDRPRTPPPAKPSFAPKRIPKRSLGASGKRSPIGRRWKSAKAERLRQHSERVRSPDPPSPVPVVAGALGAGALGARALVCSGERTRSECWFRRSAETDFPAALFRRSSAICEIGHRIDRAVLGFFPCCFLDRKSHHFPTSCTDGFTPTSEGADRYVPAAFHLI